MKGFALGLILKMRIFGTQKAFPGPGLSLHEIVSKQSLEKSRLRKQRTLCNATNGFHAKMKSEKRAQKITY